MEPNDKRTILPIADVVIGTQLTIKNGFRCGSVGQSGQHQGPGFETQIQDISYTHDRTLGMCDRSTVL